MQAAIKARAAGVPAGGFITAMGGWNPAQFAEKRLPTLAELDAAAPNHPVLVFQAFTGPAATNTRGKAFLAGKGVASSGEITILRGRAWLPIGTAVGEEKTAGRFVLCAVRRAQYALHLERLLR